MSQLGCGVVIEGRRGQAPRPGRPADAAPPDPYCLDWPERWARALADSRPELAMLFGGVWEIADWQLDGDDRWTSVLDPHFAEVVRARLTQATDLLSADGRRVLIATTPLVGPGRSGRVHEDRGIGPDHAQRVAAYNDLVRRVAAVNERVDVLEYGAYIDALDPVTNVEWLPDGIHPTEPAAFRIWDELLGSAATAAMPAEAAAVGQSASGNPDGEPA